MFFKSVIIPITLILFFGWKGIVINVCFWIIFYRVKMFFGMEKLSALDEFFLLDN